MRIMHTESSCGWGGQEIRVVADASASGHRGHEVIVCCDKNSSMRSRAKLRSDQLVARSIARKSVRGLYEMYCLIREFKPDLVLTHSSTDTWLVCVLRFVFGHQYSVIRVRHVNSPIPQNAATRWLYRQAQMIVTTSEAIRRSVHDQLGISMSNLIAIPTGVDAEHFRPPVPSERQMMRDRCGIRNGQLVYVMIATLRSWKGHHSAIRAFAQLDDGTLFIVGDGPQEASLKRLVSQLGITNRVQFFGYQQNVRPYLWAADVFLQPSTANEGVSQSLLQGMSTGLPCVVTNISGLNEVVEDEASGIFVEVDNIDQLHHALNQLASDDQLRFRLGKAGRQTVQERFSLVSMENQMEQLQQACVLSAQSEGP